MLLALEDIFKSLRIEADWFSIRQVDTQVTVLNARNGKTDQYALYQDKGAMLEVLVDNQFAGCATQDLSFLGLQQAAQKAISLAKLASPYKVFPYTLRERPCSRGTYSTPVLKTLDSLSLTEIMGVLLKANEDMKLSPLILQRLATLYAKETKINYLSSNGSQFEQTFISTALDLAAIAQEGTESQKRTNGLCEYQMGLEALTPLLETNLAETIAREAIELLKAEQCPTGIYDLLLPPDQLYIQLHESIGHPLELDRILGDERNYAGSSFITPKDFGALNYGSPLLNVTFSPLMPMEASSYEFDDIGAKAEPHFLIKEGKLLRGIGSLESQARLNIEGIATTRAQSWNRLPIDRMANINIEPGTSSLTEMIEKTERGILMTTNKSWSIDDYRRKFQFGCEYAKLIEDGKLTKTLKNPNYKGITTPFWHKLKNVGDASTFKIWGTPYCGKGEPNQVISVGHATPTCLFDKVDVFGG